MLANAYYLMIKITLKKTIITFLFPLVFFFSSSATALDSYGIYEVLNKSIARINIWENYENDNAATITGGSGVVINEKNGVYFILTNAHVILDKFCLVSEIDEENCEHKRWGDDINIAIDTPDTRYDYFVTYEDIMYWIEYDYAVIRVDMNEYILEDQYHDFNPIIIGGNWHPLMNVYGAGFPSILGNYYKNYVDIVFCSGVVNTMFLDEEALYQLSNYSIAHSCTLAGGMSGGPLVDDQGRLFGINGLTGLSDFYTDDFGNLVEIDIGSAQFNYAMDIWDLYHLEILSLEEEDGHFNPTSDFFEYLPKLSYDYHSRFYEDYIELNPERIDRIRLLFE